MVDLRHYDGSVTDLVEREDFGIILIAYNPYVIFNTKFAFE